MKRSEALFGYLVERKNVGLLVSRLQLLDPKLLETQLELFCVLRDLYASPRPGNPNARVIKRDGVFELADFELQALAAMLQNAFAARLSASQSDPELFYISSMLKGVAGLVDGNTLNGIADKLFDTVEGRKTSAQTHSHKLVEDAEHHSYVMERMAREHFHENLVGVGKATVGVVRMVFLVGAIALMLWWIAGKAGNPSVIHSKSETGPNGEIGTSQFVPVGDSEGMPAGIQKPEPDFWMNPQLPSQASGPSNAGASRR